MPAVINPNSVPQNGGSWFDSLGGIFSWGGGNDPPPMPTFQPPIPGPNHVLPPPQISQMPPIPQPSGTSTAWGGPEVMTNAAAAPPIGDNGNGTYGQMPQGEKSYSFMDNPGASDALVAFGAAMLKAPTFNQGLGDAALAVNQVAQKYRMPTEADYARARQLGMIRNIANGGDGSGSSGPSYGSKEMGYAPVGPNGEMVAVPAFLDKHGGVVYQMPDGTQSNVAPQGWIRSSDSSVGSIARFTAKGDADAENQLYTDALAANDNLIQLQQLRTIAPTAGIGLDAKTRIAREIVKLTGGNVGNIDPTSVTALEASTRQLGLNWSQKMRGQGQVTEFERQQIVEMLPQSLQDPQAFNNLVSLLEGVERRKQTIAREWFANQADLRQQYGSFRGFMLARVDEMPITAPTTGNGPDAAPSSNPELEDALKQYGG